MFIGLEILKYQDEGPLQFGGLLYSIPQLVFIIISTQRHENKGTCSPYADGRCMIMCTARVLHMLLLLHACVHTHQLKQSVGWVRHSAFLVIFLRYHSWLNLHTFEHGFNITSETHKKMRGKLDNIYLIV